MLWYNKNTNELQSTPPRGNSWVSDQSKHLYYDQGWSQVTDDFIPTIVLTTQQKINALNAEFLPKFSALRDAIQAADALGDTVTVASLKDVYIALHEEYNSAMEAIVNE